MIEEAQSGSASVRDLHGQEHVAAAVLLPVPPFDFALSARIAAAGDPRIRRFEDGRCWQAVRIGGHAALLMLHADGTVESPHLYVELRSATRLSIAELGQAREIVTRLFRLDLDVGPFLGTALADPVMATLAHRLHGLHPPGAASMFEALVAALLDQQLWTPASPGGAVSRLVHVYGDRLELVDGAHLLFPSAGTLAIAREEELRRCGLTRSRARALRGVARLVAEGVVEPEGLETIGECVDAVRRATPGAPWLAELEAVRDARRLDAIPVHDVALQRAVGRFYFGGHPAAPEQIARMAARWGRWAGLAAHHLVVAWREGVDAAGRFDLRRPGAAWSR